MLPDNFDFAMIPDDVGPYTLKEVGMTASTIEDIDYAITSWLKKDLDLSVTTNEGFKQVPVLWQAPERAFQIKNEKDLRDQNNAIKLPVVSIERTTITKDPAKKGSFQAYLQNEETIESDVFYTVIFAWEHDSGNAPVINKTLEKNPKRKGGLCDPDVNFTAPDGHPYWMPRFFPEKVTIILSSSFLGKTL